ncbi:MAG: phospholipid carrier-dependent glycosyltransferase [Candidatus Omnitrophota bacterium]
MKAFRFSSETILLFGILTIAILLRIGGVQFGLPFLYHADEPIIVNHALAFGMGDLNPHFFNIPPLVSYLLFICYGIYCLAGCAAGFFHSVRDFEQLFYLDPSSFYLIARLVFGVFLGTVSVYVLFRLVKRFGNAHSALWAAFFLAVNFLHVRDSHYVYADIPLVLVLLLGFFVFFHVSESPSSWKGHLLAGGVIGLAAATKYNGVFLVVPYVWICFRCVSWKQWLVFWFLAALGATGVFVVLNPYSILDHAFFIKEVAEQSAANSGGMPWFHYLTYSLAGALGWPMLILAISGVSLALLSKNTRSQALAVFVIAYYLVLCRFGQPYDRYVLPLVPCMVILAAEILDWLKIKSRLLFWVLIPFVILPSLIKTVHWDWLMSAPDVRTVAKNWVEANIAAGSRLALDGGFYMPRLAFSSQQLEEKKSRALSGFQSEAKMRRLDALLAKSYQPSYELYFLSEDLKDAGFLFSEPRVSFDLKALKQKGIQYILVVDALGSGGELFNHALRKNADLIVTFSPYRNREDLTIHDPQALTGGPFLWSDILLRDRGGYPISVYRLRS